MNLRINLEVAPNLSAGAKIEKLARHLHELSNIYQRRHPVPGHRICLFDALPPRDLDRYLFVAKKMIGKKAVKSA